jgi:ATP-binding cassette subfamily B (MDR/TAP) protein 6
LFGIYDKIWLAIFVSRFTIQVILVLLSLIHMFTRERDTNEADSLLATSSRRQPGYGSVPTTAAPDAAASPEPSGLKNFMAQFQKILPYIWPHGNSHLQFLIFVCFALMILGLVINVFTPVQIGRVVDEISDGRGKFAWAAVSLYVGFRFLQGGVSKKKRSTEWGHGSFQICVWL